MLLLLSLLYYIGYCLSIRRYPNSRLTFGDIQNANTVCDSFGLV